MRHTNYSVKNRLLYPLTFMLLWLLSSGVSAKVNNYLGGYAQIGEWSLLPMQSAYNPSVGVVGGLGFLYEMQAGSSYRPTRFLLDVGVGVQGGMTAFLQSTDQRIVLPNQVDLDGVGFDYVYELNDRRDRYNNVAIQIPLLVGVQHNRFYMLAGMKVGANVFTQTRSTALLNTYGEYDAFDPFYDMPEYQFFSNRPIKNGVRTHLNLDLAVSLEMGGRLGVLSEGASGYDVPKRKIECRLAGFVDYGLLDLHVGGGRQSIVTPSAYNQGETFPIYGTTSMVDGLILNDIMSTSGFASSVNNLVVGIKFTILFALPKHVPCVICQDAYRSSFRSRGGSRAGMKIEE